MMLTGNDGAEHGAKVGPKLEEVSQGYTRRLAASQGARYTGLIVRIWLP